MKDLPPNVMNAVIARAKGNPGALTAQIEFLTYDNPFISLQIEIRLDRCKTIRGINLYVLYSDLCNKDIELVSKLCSSNISDKLLEDTCSRQDYSGRELIKDFI